MPLLENFLKSQFNPELNLEFNNLIDELGLRNFFNNTISILNDPEIEKDETTIAALSAGLLRNINHKLAKFTTVEDKISRQRTFGILLERLLVSLISKNLKNTEQIFAALDRSLYITCLQQGYDHKLMKKLFDFDGLKHIIYNLKLKTNTVTTHTQKSQKYIWLQKGNLHELVDLLARHNYIKSKKEFFDIFLKQDDCVCVRWNKEKKKHLALLLFRLFTEGYAKIEGNKGYFTFAEKHFVTFDKNRFLPNSLKKLSSSITKKPENYTDIIAEVDDLLRLIAK